MEPGNDVLVLERAIDELQQLAAGLARLNAQLTGHWPRPTLRVVKPLDTEEDAR